MPPLTEAEKIYLDGAISSAGLFNSPEWQNYLRDTRDYANILSNNTPTNLPDGHPYSRLEALLWRTRNFAQSLNVNTKEGIENIRSYILNALIVQKQKAESYLPPNQRLNNARIDVTGRPHIML